MKYWIFDGSDVVGPLTPKELAARPDFVAVSLICPEYASQKASGWRRASSFSEFHFDESSGKLQLVSVPENEPTSEMLARKRMRKPSRPSRAMINGFVKLSGNKHKNKVSPPVHLANGGDLDLSLPKQETSLAKQKALPEDRSTQPADKEAPQQDRKPAESLVHDMALMPEKNGGELPPLPEGDGTRLLTADALQTEDLPEKELFLTTDEDDVEEERVEPIREEFASQELSPDGQENQSSLPDTDDSISTVSQIKSRLLPTPEIEEFLTDQQLSIVRPHDKNTKKILIILLALLLLPGVGYFTWKIIHRPAVKPAATVETVGAEELALALTEPENSSAGKVVPAAAPAPVTAAEKALAAVQNYRLSEDRGTIASYFDRIYQDRLAQGYTAAWSVEPLHKSTYIVKYRLTKTRTEPIVYVFQADAQRNRLTGALNNAALDLIGKN